MQPTASFFYRVSKDIADTKNDRLHHGACLLLVFIGRAIREVICNKVYIDIGNYNYKKLWEYFFEIDTLKDNGQDVIGRVYGN